jgi:hypothetical protein
MERSNTTLMLSTLRGFLGIALLGGGLAHAATPASQMLTPHARDANGIAIAVTELLPAIGDCLDSDRVLGGPGHMKVLIAFNVIESGEIGDLVIDGLESRTATSTLPTCLEGTISAMRFAPGDRSIPVQLPLQASAESPSQIY